MSANNMKPLNEIETSNPITSSFVMKLSSESNSSISHLVEKAQIISRFKKERYLLMMSEDDFRDHVVRPLFLRMGLVDGRDLCGKDEKGKDALFVAYNQLRLLDVYVLQTKKGALTLARKTSHNIEETITQLKTALATRYCFIDTKEKKLPSKVILCTSGKINDSAREHILASVSDPRLIFMDSDDLIPKIDVNFPELWLGMDANLVPYFRLIKESIEGVGENLSVADVLPGGIKLSAASDKMFVPLRLYRTILKLKKQKGQVLQVPKFEEIPLNGILSKREKLFLIIGDAGSGKSTSLRRLAYILATKGLQTDKERQIPILLRASEIFDKNPSTLVDMCVGETTRIMQSSQLSFTSDDLQNGRMVIMIDALDEISDDLGKKSVVELVNQFHKHYPECKVIITSREYAFVKTMHDLKEFELYRLSPIGYKEAEQIVKRLQKAKSLSIEESNEVLRRLQEVHGIELNPLLVTVFAATTEYSRRDIPANITELFKKFTEMMLGRWDMSKGLAHQYHAPLKDFVLTRVAFEMHRRRVTYIDINEFKTIIANELSKRGHKADVNQLLDEILNRSGLFRTSELTVEFRHLLLQEFFAGRGIPSNDYLETLISEEWWRRAIVFYFGEHPDGSSALFAVKKSIASRQAREIFSAAITIGLALQACYLVEIEKKIDVFQWVINGLAIGKHNLSELADGSEKYPLTRFIAYYLFGRDSVACSFLEDKYDEIVKLVTGNVVKEDEDIRKFWIIIGLIESGAIEKAEKIIKGFHPNDPKLLLAIHLGCFIIQHLKVATKEQRKIAERISSNLAELVANLRTQVLKEFTTELLEIRQGQIKAVKLPKMNN